MTANEIGCLHSHLTAWKLISSGDEMGLVMEDDVHLSPRLPILLRDLSRDANNLEIIKLDASDMGIDVVRSPEFRAAPYKGHVLAGDSTNAGAYIVNPRTARLLYQRCLGAQEPVDIEMYHNRSTNADITKIQVLPAPVQHDVHVSEGRLGFGSSIGQRENIKKNRHVSAKKMLRPLYYWALSVVQYKAGIRRTRIKFY